MCTEIYHGVQNTIWHRVFNFLLVMTSWNIDFYAIDQSRETCTDFDTLYEWDLTSGIDFADAPALCGYLDDVTLHVDDLNVCGL
jgi:hypothetical protein